MIVDWDCVILVVYWDCVIVIVIVDVANDSNTKIDGGSQVHCDLPKPGLLLRPDGASSEKVILSYFPLNFHSS